jgi:hypothetical protein
LSVTTSMRDQFRVDAERGDLTPFSTPGKA